METQTNNSEVDKVQPLLSVWAIYFYISVRFFYDANKFMFVCQCEGIVKVYQFVIF